MQINRNNVWILSSEMVEYVVKKYFKIETTQILTVSLSRYKNENNKFHLECFHEKLGKFSCSIFVINSNKKQLKETQKTIDVFKQENNVSVVLGFDEKRKWYDLSVEKIN